MLKFGSIKTFLSLTLLFFVIGFPRVAYSQFFPTVEEKPETYTRAGLIAYPTEAKGGETVRVGLVLNIHPKWHVYWKNPGDSGTPPSIKWELPPNFSVSELEFPNPKKISYGPLTNYGHEGYVVLLQNLTLPKKFTDEALMLKAKVNLLVCHDICIPESHDVSLLLNSDKTENNSQDGINYGETLLPPSKDWQATYNEQNDDFIIDVTADDVDDILSSYVFELFPEDWGAIDNNASASLRQTDNGFQIIQKRGNRHLNEIQNLNFVLSYKNAVSEEKFVQFNAKLSERPFSANSVIEEISESGFNLFQALIFALFGGLILNLMPCVFPVLSMKALSLIGLQSKEEKKARGYGLSYTAGILLSFALIGGTLLALRAAGQQIGWGFQLQSPVIIILLTYLVFLVGLNFAGLFEFTGRFSNIGNKLTQASGNRGAFFTGVLATLVATPCTAPFMGAAMGFALTQPAYISMIVFLALGLGLALPYLLLCFVPALRSKLPKAGHWMETFRQFLAFPMFITTAWLVWVLSQQINSLSVFYILLSLIAIIFVIWLLRVLPKKGLGRILSLILVFASLAFIISSSWITSENIRDSSSFMQLENKNWEEFTPRKLAGLLEETDDPVFTNMTAAWCITCKVNEKVALSTDTAEELFEEKNIQYLKGDWTNQNPDITKYLNSFDRQGVPLYVYYGARDEQTGKRPEPVVLPQILTPGLVVETIRGQS